MNRKLSLDRGRHPADRHQKAVTPPGDGLNKTRVLRAVSQCVPKPADGGIEAVIEIDKSVGGPQTGPQLVPRDHLAGPFQQQGQNLERLFLQFDSGAVAPKFSRPQDRLRRLQTGSSASHCCSLRSLALSEPTKFSRSAPFLLASPTLLSI